MKSNVVDTNLFIWFKHILFITKHDKGIWQSNKLCLALSILIHFTAFST